jgi:mono/diheme cytochrome c family protein
MPPQFLLHQFLSSWKRCKLRAFRLTFLFVSAGIALAPLETAPAFAQKQNLQNAGKTAEGGAVARGKYLVENVAMCGQCHTPRDSNGSAARDRWLQGSPVPWTPSQPDSNWPINAPRIGGTPLPASDADMVKLLTTGVWTTGTQLRPPMPQFRMNRSDAEAVVAYLKSLTSQPAP